MVHVIAEPDIDAGVLVENLRDAVLADRDVGAPDLVDLRHGGQRGDDDEATDALTEQESNLGSGERGQRVMSKECRVGELT